MERIRDNTVYVTHEEAQRLRPYFEYLAVKGPWKEVRTCARSILYKLKSVRPMDYSPLEGYQMFLSSREYQLYNDVINELG